MRRDTEPVAASAEVTDAGLESLRPALTGFCYRMLGAAAEAEDAVQETLIRALRHRTRFDPRRAALSTWLHAIATRVCLDLLKGARRRALPWDLGPATAVDGGASGGLGAVLPAARWVDPIADARWRETADPADLTVERESIRLAFVVALQRLPPRQRAVLILRDVLAFSAAETAQVLECSVGSVTSALQRARTTLEAPPARPQQAGLDATEREVLQRYVEAFEAHDMDRLIALLATDARSGMPPFAWWIVGAATIASITSQSDACRGDRLIAGAFANGSPTLGQYRPDERGELRPFALLVVDIRGGRISEVVTFLGCGERFPEFGLPTRLPSALLHR